MSKAGAKKRVLILKEEEFMNWSEILSLATLLGLIIGGIIGFYKFFKGIGAIRQDIRYALTSVNAFLNSHGILVHILSSEEKAILSGADVTEMYKPLEKATREPINRLMTKIGTEAKNNPLTTEEANRLRDYVRRYQRGETLAPTQVEDFYQLSKALEREEEYRQDIGVTLLVGLAGFLLGLIVGKALTE